MAQQHHCEYLQPLICGKEGSSDRLEWGERLAFVTCPTITAVWHNNHWFPFLATPADHAVEISSCPEGFRLWNQIASSAVVWSPASTVDLPTCFREDCGFQVIAWLLGALGLQSPHAMTEHTAICHRLNFWYDHLWSALKSHTQRFVLGGQSELETAVATMLREHGVFTNRVLDRTKSVLQQLGQQPVTQALRSARPWAALKALANEHTPKIRLIWEDEFSHVVKSRTGKDNKFGTKKKNK